MATILTIIPYNFYPPMGGGALRCFYLLREMARRHTIYLLTVQQGNDFEQKFSPPFPENVNTICISDSNMYRSIFNFLPAKIANAINFRILNKTLKGSTDISLLEIYPALNEVLNRVKFDIIYYENLEALSLLGNLIRSRSPSSIKMYDAHNVDSELWLQYSISENKSLFTKYAKKSLITEQSLFKIVDIFFSCSERDNEKLTTINKNKITGIVIPNGVDTDVNPFDTNSEKCLLNNIIFCGSLDYFPNREGLLWFYEKVFPLLKEKLPSVSLTVIGNISNNDNYKFLENDDAVNFIGKVESVVPYYHNSSVSIVPLRSGSGTRLKILEAMSLGNPVVSTSIGAEGIDYLDRKNLLIADDSETFTNSILSLLNNPEMFDQLRYNALELVKTKYDWSKIGSKINQAIDDVLSKRREVKVNA